MISQAPQIRVKTNSPIGNDVFFALPNLQGNNSSFLEADVALGASTLTANGMFFSANQYIILGQPGQDKSEILKISSVNNTTITTTTNTIFSHNRGDVITFIEYNQIVPERATTLTGSYSALTTIDINPQVAETYLQRTGDATTDAYQFRFYNATSGLYSGYSDPILASGYDDNTVFAIKQRALTQLGEKISDLITDNFLNDALNEARRIVDMGTATVDKVSQRVLRWSFRTKFNTDIGNLVPGAWSVTAPTDLRDRNTFKNILGLRLGRSNWPCVYQDQKRFRQNYLNVAHSTLNGAITTGSTSIILTSSGDFDASGTIYIGAESVLLTNDAVAYTANNVSTNTLSGVTGITSAGHATGRDVWQQATFGMPTAFTIDNGTIYFDVPFADTYAGENIYLDYYQSLTAVNSDSDTVDEPFYDLYVPYLKFKIKTLKSNGALKPTDDGDYLLFQQGLAELVSQEVSGQNVNFVPDFYGSLNGGGGRGWY
jgi:hypothetical protein